MRIPARRWRRVLACGILLLLATACGPARERWAPPISLITEDPTKLWDPTKIVTEKARFLWRFETDGDLRSWALGGGLTGSRLVRAGLLLEGQRVLLLTRRVSLSAADVDAIELRLSKLPNRGEVTLEWVRAGQSWSPQQRLQARRAAPGGKSNSLRLDLLRHPQWRGEIKRLRFRIRLARAREVILRQMRGVSQTLQEGRLAAALARPWMAALGHDMRYTLLSVPNLPIARRLDIPPGGRLELSYGVEEGVAGPVRFRASVDSGEEAEHEVFSAQVRADEQGEWQSSTIDLSDYGGRTVELRLTTESEAPFDPRRGFALWANPEVATAAPEGAPPNVVLISVDTLRADHLSLYGYHRVTSPEIDGWAGRHAAVFTNAVAPSPWTLPSHVSMLTGLAAYHHGVNYAGVAPASLTLVAELLRQAGYRTVAITGSGYVHPRWGLGQGFTRFHYFDDWLGSSEELVTGVDRALRFLEEAGERPFFLFFHTYEVHSPFRARQPYFNRFSRHPASLHVRWQRLDRNPEDGFFVRQAAVVSQRGKVLRRGRDLGEYETLPADLYDSGIAYTDQQIARLFERLEELGLRQRTIVVLTSDHGEMLGEHGLFTHHYLYEENLLVPLVVADPAGRGAGQRIDSQVRVVDVVPTILDLAGVDAPPGLDGVSLVPLMEGLSEEATREAWSYAAGSNHGISVRLGNRLKYIARNDAWVGDRPLEELYDLRRDPDESANLALTSGGTEQLRARVKSELQEAPGLRLRLSNSGSDLLHWYLSGPAISPDQVKITGVGCNCLRWLGDKAAELRIQPGESITLWLDNVQQGTLSAGLSLGSDLPEEVMSFDLGTFAEPLAVVRSDSGWARVDGPLPDGVTGLALFRQGEPALQRVPVAAGNIELRRRLRVLGYVQ